MSPWTSDAGAVPLPGWIRSEDFWADPASPLAAWPRPATDSLRLTWLGTACFLVESASTTLLIDPFLSRPGLWTTLSAPLVPDERVLALWANVLPRPDALLVGHAHHDHALDAAPLARRLRTPLLASPGALRLARVQGLPQNLAEPVHGGLRRTIGDLEITWVPSAHAPLTTQRFVGGSVAPDPRPPLRLRDWRNDEVHGLRIRWRGRTIHHGGSAEVVGQAGEWAPTDVLLFCMAGWTAAPGLLERIRTILSPRVLIPMHHDDFFRPLARGYRPLAAARLPLASRLWPRALPVTAFATANRYLQSWTLQPAS